jgi:hypothetical protein
MADERAIVDLLIRTRDEFDKVNAVKKPSTVSSVEFAYEVGLKHGQSLGLQYAVQTILAMLKDENERDNDL